MKIIYIIIVFLISDAYLFSLNFITTGKSVSFYGAHASISDGFESMLYNPAGLYMTDSKYGFNFFGTYGVRAYSNSITTDNVLNFFLAVKQGRNLSKTKVIDDIINLIPENGFDFGANASIANLMIFTKLKDFSLGISIIPKTDITFCGDKKLVYSIFKKLDLTKTLSFGTKFSALQYIDLNITLSTRFKVLEEKLKVESIFTGLSTHFYIPTLFINSNSSFSMNHLPANKDGIIDEYNLKSNTDLIVGGNGVGFLTNIPFFKENYGENILKDRSCGGFGFGIDLGFIIKFNYLVKLGFSITDLGFLVFPNAVHTNIKQNNNLKLNSMGAVGDILINGLLGKSDNRNSEEKTEFFMPGTAIRTGIALTPIKNSELLTIMCDISVSDFNRIINKNYATFSISTGIEVKPSYKWFSIPFRAAFNYNTQVNVGSFSFGMGLYFGPVHFDIGVKGIEILFYDIGAKEFCLGLDLTVVY